MLDLFLPPESDLYFVDGGRYTAFARLFFRRAASCETVVGGIGLLHPPELFEIRNRNLAEVLAALRRSAPCSLAQLVEETEIGLTTVKKCIEQCVASGMVLYGEIAASTGGRKAQQYLLNPKYQYYLMLLTDNNTFVCRLYDFNCCCVAQTRRSFSMEHFFEQLCGAIRFFLSEYEVGTLCLSLPCVVKDGKIVDWYYNPALQGFPMQEELERCFGVHVLVQNDMKLTVLGAASNMRETAMQNLVTAQFGHNGIGVGEMVNGQVLEGFSGFAGEVGYTRDIRKDIAGTAYLAKIVRSVIICINPQKIIFYRSDRQNRFDKIFEEAVRGLPSYAIPEYTVSEAYFQDMTDGFFRLIDRKGYYKKGSDPNA